MQAHVVLIGFLQYYQLIFELLRLGHKLINPTLERNLNFVCIPENKVHIIIKLLQTSGVVSLYEDPIV